MDRVRIGIIGTGQIGKHHVEQYAKIPQAEIVAVADIDEAEARRVAAKAGIPDVYTDFRKILARPDVQAVDVCLHNNYHAPLTIEALRAGKHVYCEKPMAGSYADAAAMLAEAKKCGLKLSIQLSTLFSKGTREAQRLIAEGRLGKIYHARSSGFRRRGRPYVDGYGSRFFVYKPVSAGGALFDMGVYHIAQILYLLGQPAVERVSGRTYQETAVDPKRGKEAQYSVEELGLGFVRLAGGVSLDIIEAWAVHMNRFEGSAIFGSQGGIRLEPFSFHTVAGDAPLDAAFDLEGADWRRHKLDPAEECYDSAQHHWVAALQGRTELLPTAQIALATMLISQGIYFSDSLGREVTTEEVVAKSVSTALKV